MAIGKLESSSSTGPKATGGSIFGKIFGNLFGDQASADSIISGNEGGFGSVNSNDGGALSIGKYQWHAGRAKELLSMIKNSDPKTFNAVLGGTQLEKEIMSNTNWSNRKLSKAESNLVSTLLNSESGVKIQQQLAARDLNGYMEKGRSLGVEEEALPYFADLYNQSPKNAIYIAKISNGTLKSLHANALAHPVMGKYKSRRNATYQKILKSR